MFMKFKDIARVGFNKANNQYSLNLRSKQLKKIGITPKDLLEFKLPNKKDVLLKGSNANKELLEFKLPNAKEIILKTKGGDKKWKK